MFTGVYVSQVSVGKIFGRKPPHTLIIASGDSIRHWNIHPWMLGLAISVVSVIAIGYLLATTYLVLRDDLIGAQRMIYVLNLTQPNGLFIARDFVIRDGDTVYVTEAPYNQFTKILNAIVAPASTAASLDSLTE